MANPIQAIRQVYDIENLQEKMDARLMTRTLNDF